MKLLLSPLQTAESPHGTVLFDLLPRAKDGDEKLRRENRGQFCPPKHPSRYLVPATHHSPGRDRDLKSQNSRQQLLLVRMEGDARGAEQ